MLKFQQFPEKNLCFGDYQVKSFLEVLQAIGVVVVVVILITEL